MDSEAQIPQRALAEEALRESEERFRALTMATSDVVYRMGPDWKEMRYLQGRQFLADTAARTTSWLDKYIHPDDQPQVLATIHEAIRTKSTFELEHRVVRADGSLGWTASRAVPLLNERGEIVEWFGAASDVTARKQAELAERESATKYRSLFESIDEGFCIIEVLFEADQPVDYRFIETNPSFERQTGIMGGVGRRMRDIAPNHEEHWFQIYGKVARSGEPVRFRNPAQALDRFFDVYAFRIGRPEQRQVAILFNDITEQTRAQQALHESEKLKAFLLELSDALRPLADAADFQEVVARIARNFFATDRCYYCEIEGNESIIRSEASRDGLPSVAGVYALHALLISETVLAAGRPFVVRDANTPDLMDQELRQLCNQMQIVSFLAVPVIKDSKPAGILCLTQSTPRDWTESDIRLAMEAAERTWAAVARARASAALRESEARLREADRRKDEFLAMLGHELRNPLAAIRSATDLVKLIAGQEPHVHRAHGVLERQSKHMTQLIDALLEVSRITLGKIRLNRSVLDLRVVLEGVLHDRMDQLVARGLQLRLEPSPKPLWVCGDQVRLAQVFDNLLGNAIKYTPLGSITVSMAREDDSAVVRVRDTGVGIRPELLSYVFDPFQQEAQDSARSPGGLGLGLAVAKGLVELHEGSIAARSAGPGAGAEFLVRLPIALAPPGRQAVEQGAGISPKRVLLVEDNEDLAMVLSDVLELEGHEVETASTGDRALEVLRRRGTDVVLCDIGLPGMDGYEVARAIRADPSLRETHLVALTGYGQPEDRQRSREAGFDDHLTKPVALSALQVVLGRRFG